MITTISKLDEVKKYCGRIFAATSDLKTSACCTTGPLPEWQKDMLKGCPENR